MRRVLTFIAGPLLLLSGIHYYIWIRLIGDQRLAPPWNTIATVVLAVLGTTLSLLVLLGRRYPGLHKALAWPAYFWLGIAILLTVVLLAVDLVRLLLGLGRAISRSVAVDARVRSALSAAATALKAGGGARTTVIAAPVAR